MSKTICNILILPVLTLVIGLACNLSGGPTPPRPVSTAVPEEPSLQQQVKTLQSQQKPDKITLTITESQMSAYLQENVGEEYSSLLADPVVIFQPDRAELYGTIKSDSFSVNGKIAMNVTVDPDGKPLVKIIEANFGPFPVPAPLLDNLTQAVDRALSKATQDYQSDYRLESIQFSQGTATVTLVKK